MEKKIKQLEEENKSLRREMARKLRAKDIVAEQLISQKNKQINELEATIQDFKYKFLLLDMAEKEKNNEEKEEEGEVIAAPVARRRGRPREPVFDRMNPSPNIMDIPDKILTKILLNLRATERVPLGDSCKKFRALVFQDKQLLRNLDFSADEILSAASDIHRYFINEHSSRHILGINLRSFTLGGQVENLPNYFHEAINLVELNIHGTRFRDLMQVERFLCPFRNLKRLSLNWPLWRIHVDNTRPKGFEEVLGRLTYWSVTLWTLEDFTLFCEDLSFCQKLRELRITTMPYEYNVRWSSDQTIPLFKLKDIEIIEYTGPFVREVEECLVSLIPCPKEWTRFQISKPMSGVDGFYLEKNVEVCEELMESKAMNRRVYNYPNFTSELGGFFSPRILVEVMKINGKHSPNKFCCFSSVIHHKKKGWVDLSTIFHGSKQWTLKLEEAKRLLKDPKYQISYVNIFHNIEEKCEAHIVTSAFSSLTELVLSNVTKVKQTNESDGLDQLPNLDSSFSKIVRNTPHVKHLTVIADMSQLKDDEVWDLASLHLIPGWQNLTSLRLWHIPIMDGIFLTEIGKQCKHLETVELFNLGPEDTYCFMSGLMRMLMYCSKLRYFMLRQDRINRVSDLLFLLAKNPKLRRVYIRGESSEQMVDLVLPVEQLLVRCSELTQLMCFVDEFSSKIGFDEEAACAKLSSALKRLKTELNPSCQFRFHSSHYFYAEDESIVPYSMQKCFVDD